MSKGILSRIKAHWLSILVVASGWFILIPFLVYEYAAYGSRLPTHLMDTTPSTVIFHVMILLAPLWSMFFGYFVYKKTSLEQELQEHTENLEQKVEEKTKEVNASEEKYRGLIDKVAYGIVLISPKMEIIELNAQMRKWFPDIKVDDRPICYKTFNVPPKDGVCDYCPTIKTLRDGEVHTSITLTPAGDKIINYRVISSPVKDASGNITAAIELVEDITKTLEIERDIEKQTREYQANLEKQVSERTKELEDSRNAVMNVLEDLDKEHKKLENAYSELKELERMKDDIISNVSHELKTPITIIKGAIELAMEEKDPSERFELLMKAKKALLRQEPIIENLVDVSLVKRGIHDFKQNTVDINRLIEEGILKKRLMSLERKVEIETSLQQGMPFISVNEAGIRKVVSNLLDNAIKFNKMRGKVTVTTKDKGSEIEVSITDTGIGVPKEQLEKIFEPLYQVDATSTRKYGGVGMGLTVVKSVVEMHGGRAWAESEPNKGTTFYFTIHKYKRG